MMHLSMKSTFFVVSFLALCFGPATVRCAQCNTSSIYTCVAGMGSLDFEDKDNMCKSLGEMTDCLNKLKTSCQMDDAQKSSMEQSMNQIKSVNAVCQETQAYDDVCHSGASTCLSPMEEFYNNNKTKDIEASKVCPIIQDASSCLKKLLPKCEDGEAKRDISGSIQGFVTQGGQYKCKDNGYTITGLSKGLMVQPTVSVFLLSVLVVAFGRLLQTSVSQSG